MALGMNVKRFTARTPRDALALVKQAFGEDAVVMSTRPCAEGVEVLAMAPESLNQIERVGAEAEVVRAPARAALPALPAAAAPARAAVAPALPEPGGRIEPSFGPEAGGANSIEQDVQQLQMSTLSFQDYVRERMLKRRQTEIAQQAAAPAKEPEPARPAVSPIEAARQRLAAQQAARQQQREAAAREAQRRAEPLAAAAPAHEPPVLREELRLAEGLPVVPAAEPAAAAARPARAGAPAAGAAAAAAPIVAPSLAPQRDAARDAARDASRQEALAMMSELRSMRGLIEQRFGALAFMEKLQRQPRQAQLAQKLLDIGLSAALTRKLAESLPDDVAELTWASGVLERNLATGEREASLEDQGGVYAMIGATGVGKTTGTAKLAAAFATQHGAANLGLITLDAYRVGAHEQLRTYGRILGVPVHTAHDRASLDDLLDLLAAKRMVLIDTAGVSQRDERTRELLEMLSHPSIKRLVVVNASAQGETIEDQLAAYAAPGCRGVVLSKVDEAVKLGPALDALIRSRLKVLAVANGQRVPEDWHRLSAHALVQRALRATGSPAWRLDHDDVNLIFAGMPNPAAKGGRPAAAAAGV